MKRGLLIAILLATSSILVWFSIVRRPVKSSAPEIALETIVVGTTAEYQPFTFVEGEEVVGFDIDLVTDVCSRLGATIELKNMPFTALIPALQQGSIQIAASGMTPTKERSRQVLFTPPYVDQDPLLILSLAQNPPITSVDELNGKKVIVNEGYTSDTFISSKTGPIIERVTNPAAGFDALKSGQGDAFVIAQSSAQPFFDLHGKTEFNITPIEDSADTYALAVSKKYPELLLQIQTMLDQIKNDGTLERLKKKWALQ